MSQKKTLYVDATVRVSFRMEHDSENPQHVEGLEIGRQMLGVESTDPADVVKALYGAVLESTVGGTVEADNITDAVVRPVVTVREEN